MITGNTSETLEQSKTTSGGQDIKINKQEDLPKENAQTTGVSFVESEMLKPLLEQAKVENKLVFIDFYTD